MAPSARAVVNGHRRNVVRAPGRSALLAALTFVLALLLPATPASAAAPLAAETRVGASTVATAVVVGVHECITAGQRPVRGPSQPQIAAGTCVAAKAGTEARKPAIVIGEDMEGRVIPKAKELGAGYYDPPPAPRSQWMDNNRRWLNDRMDEGCTIYNCGPAPGRPNYPNPTSPYYQMELDEIAKRGYPMTNVGGP